MMTFIALILSTMRSTAPIMLAAVGGNFAARTGTMALGMEGFMLIGAFFAAFGSYLTGSSALGLLFGVGAALIFSLIFGLLVIKFNVNQVIGGIGMNMLASGITASLTQIVWGNRGYSVNVATLPKLHIGSNFSISYIVILAFVVAIVAWIYMFRTPYGLRLRVVGENPVAAETNGVKVKRYRYLGILMCGLLCGIAGSYLSIDHVNRFVREMTAGRGYIAVAVNILGAFNPLGSLWGGMLFGFIDSLDTVVASSFIPSPIMQMFPYVVTMIVVIFYGKKVVPPAGMNPVK